MIENVTGLPPWKSVLAVCAHPDDESFGLGGVLATLTGSGTECSVLCFTHGEASTLGTGGAGSTRRARSPAEDLRQIRADELEAAAAVLGVGHTTLLDYPDGRLDDIPLEELSRPVETLARRYGADALVVFDTGGITGHPDHIRATEAALRAARNVPVPVVAWAVDDGTARKLNEELGTAFVGIARASADIVVTVDRRTQRAAIARHGSQARGNDVVWRRLELSGEREVLRVLSGTLSPGAPVTSCAPWR